MRDKHPFGRSLRFPAEEFPTLDPQGLPVLSGWAGAVRVMLTMGGGDHTCTSCEAARQRARADRLDHAEVVAWIQRVPACGSGHVANHLTVEDEDGLVMLSVIRGVSTTELMAADHLWDMALSGDEDIVADMLASFAPRARLLFEQGESDPKMAFELVDFALAGWEPDEAREAIAAGMTSEEAYGYTTEVDMDHEIGPREALAWFTALKDEPRLAWKNTAMIASEWLRAGVPLPDLRPAGLSSQEALALREAEQPLDSAWATGNWSLCSRLVKVAVGHATPKDAVALFDALLAGHQNPHPRCMHALRGADCGQNNDAISEALAWVRRWAGLPFGDLAMCLRAGMTREEAETHVRDGKDMDPIRLLAALTRA